MLDSIGTGGRCRDRRLDLLGSTSRHGQRMVGCWGSGGAVAEWQRVRGRLVGCPPFYPPIAGDDRCGRHDTQNPDKRRLAGS